MNFRKFQIAVAVMLLAGCTVGPNFVKPDAAVPKTWCTSACEAIGSEPSRVSSQPVTSAWWTSFNDPELVKLEDAVAGANLDLKVASLRLAESRATRTITAADKYPSVEANADVKRAQASANGVLGALTPGLGDDTAPINVYEAGFDASWELDLWGQVSRQVEAADASVEIQGDERRGLLLSTMAEVARDYTQPSCSPGVPTCRHWNSANWEIGRPISLPSVLPSAGRSSRAGG
jgi:outer membrane protein TolC